MSAWDSLHAELAAWADAGRIAEFWWRDDDATEATPALDRLLRLRALLGVPLALAAVPARVQASLAEALSKQSQIDVLQHGYAHANHRPAGEKKAELGAGRPLWDVARELADGRGRMVETFGVDGWLEVMVPPWNRIHDSVASLLPGLGFHGLSVWQTENRADAGPLLRVVNTHVDIVDWAGSRGFAGEDAAIAAAVAHLAAKRMGATDPDEATGLLTHHLAHDDGCWAFVERFVAETAGHTAARWRSARDLFPPPE